MTRTNNILSASGSTLGITGAIMIALNIGLFFLGYILFFISALVWVVYAYRTEQSSLLRMNVVFAVINAVGIYNFS
jgi:hypothetical protein